MEPDATTLICGHPDAGLFGLFIKREPLPHCAGFVKFKQHPRRNPDGTLKSTTAAKVCQCGEPCTCTSGLAHHEPPKVEHVGNLNDLMEHIP